MIPLVLPAVAEAEAPFVTRLRGYGNRREPFDSCRIGEDGACFAGPRGLVVFDGIDAEALDGDIVLVDPAAGRAERLLRAGSAHNTLLVTERCDQLCLMCSQPPKKNHIDRFALLREAALLAEEDTIIGVTGGEPTLYKDQLLDLVESVLGARPDLQFHILTNAQHFEEADVARIRQPLYARVAWGVPLYAASPALHDEIVGKAGAYRRLEASLAHLLLANARVELRTVLLTLNAADLPALASLLSARLGFIESWSIMQLEHIGFARRRWQKLYYDHGQDFAPIAAALGHALLHGISTRLFNFPRCTVPAAFRPYAAASISDWKRAYPASCSACREREACGGFFAWHPDAAVKVRPL